MIKIMIFSYSEFFHFKKFFDFFIYWMLKRSYFSLFLIFNSNFSVLAYSSFWGFAIAKICFSVLVTVVWYHRREYKFLQFAIYKICSYKYICNIYINIRLFINHDNFDHNPKKNGILELIYVTIFVRY